jgi:hypothetical protein
MSDEPIDSTSQAPTGQADASPGGTHEAPRVPREIWLVAVLVAWALAVITLLDRTPFGLDEASARVVLLLWSASDDVPAPIVTLGVPDFRALFLAPAGILFSGSLLAAKIFTLLFYLAAVVGLYRWRTRGGDTEGPLLATGLLLIAPLAVGLIDRLSIAVYLLLCLLLGAWAEEIYRATRVRFGGWYFAQLLLCLALATLHPAGLAYPVMLAAGWMRRDAAEVQGSVIPGRERTHMLAGIFVATLAGLLLADGWPHQSWFGQPLASLARGILAFDAQADSGDTVQLLLGLVLAAGVLATVWFARHQWRADAFGRPLVLALAISASCADASFVLLALVLLLHWGFPLLLRLRLGSARGFIGQRGPAFLLLLVLSTVFLLADKSRYLALQREPDLSAQDRLIRTLANEVQQAMPAPAAPGRQSTEEKAHSGPKVASQWPGRTMIACRCSTLPLPPALADEARFAGNLRGIDFAVFDPNDPANRALAQDFALLGGERAQTIALQAGGVVLRLRGAASTGEPPAFDAGH